MSTPTPSVTLSSTSAKMPLVGLGLWKVPNEVCAQAVYSAIQAGYRLFDGASDYGNEVDCGKGVAKAIKDGLVKREELFITSKLWNTFHAEEHVLPACERSLKDWGLDYFDLYLIHFPISLKHVPMEERYPPGWSVDGAGTIAIEPSPLYKTWGAMETLTSKGLVKNIGISNFAGGLVMDLLTYAKIKPAVLQVEMHPFHAQQDLIDLCKAFDIHLTAYCSYGPQSWIELNDPKVQQVGSLFKEPHVTSAAKAHGKTAAQVLLRWATQRGIAVIPKTSNAERLAENLASTDFYLTDDEMMEISALDRAFRFNQPHGIDSRISIFA